MKVVLALLGAAVFALAADPALAKVHHARHVKHIAATSPSPAAVAGCVLSAPFLVVGGAFDGLNHVTKDPVSKGIAHGANSINGCRS